MTRAVLGLGSNLGARRALLGCAQALLAAQPGLRVLAASPLYHTPPLGPPQPDYLNAALLIDWVGTPRSLLALTQHVETLLQRQRAQHWGPRTLDIDLLYWEGGEVRVPGLSVPHPELVRRSFALAPLLDVLPELEPRYGAALVAVGGRPLRHEPWQPSFERQAAALVTAPCDEPAELVSALGSALAGCFGARVFARSVLPFRAPAEVDAPLLERRLRAAFAGGFLVARVAVTEVREGKLSGVLVGQQGGGPARLPALRVTLEPGGPISRARVLESLDSALWP